MVVTIIGSLSKKDKMLKAKQFFESVGNTVNCPCDDPGREKMPLLTKQFTWIEKIEEADLVVAIPKYTKILGGGQTKHVLEFGESTSYELAIALRFNKQIIIW